MNIFLIVILCLIILLLILTFIMGYVLVSQVILPNRRTWEYVREENAPFEDAFVDYETVWERKPFTLPVENAVISGECIINSNGTERKKVAIICHGHTVLRAADLKYAKMFYKLGYNIVIFDHRYFGESTGKYCTLGMNESRDVAAIIRYARTVFGDDAFIVLHGESMGAASSLLSLQYESPDLVFADCPFASTKKLFEYLGKKRIGIFTPLAIFWGWVVGMVRCRYNFFKVNPMDAVQKSEVPICFIHGLADTYIPCSHSEMMKPLSKNLLSELHLIPEANHAESVYVDTDGYVKILENFLKKVEG